MKHSVKSIVISKIVIVLFFVCGAACMIFAPSVANAYLQVVGRYDQTLYPALMTLIYTLGPAGIAVLVLLYKLIDNIHKGAVFTKGNVSLLRALSYLCFAAAVALLIFTYYFIFAVLVAAAAGFMGLIIRIIKNIMETAMLIKEENDYTI